MRIHASLPRNVPCSGVPSRQRTANKQAEGPTAVLAIRPLTCTSWYRGQDLNLRPLGYEDREAPFNPVRHLTGQGSTGQFSATTAGQ
jgi:hypothetical protein